MSNDNFNDLSQLWQAETPNKKVDIAALQQRYKKQRRVMGFNLLLEICILLLFTAFAVTTVVQKSDVLVQVWTIFMVVWGWSLFIPLCFSRWRSFNLMKSKSLDESLQEHIQLVKHEIWRWRLSFYATVFVGLVTLVYLGSALVLNSVGGSGTGFFRLDLLIDLVLITGVTGAAIWFHRCKKASEQVLETLLQ